MNDLLLKKAKEIIEKNIYITLATVGEDGLPWASPLYAAYDEDYNFYWSSDRSSKHSQNIDFQNTISFVIFDSTAPWGEGESVFIEANVEELRDKEQVLAAFVYRYGRINKPQDNPDDFLGESPKRIYKAAIKKAWILSSSKQQGYFNDGRIEINLK